MNVIPVTPKEIRMLAQSYTEDFGKLCMVMDEAHSEEFARYDRQKDVLFVNGALLPQAPVWAVYFYLFRALRYGEQCRHGERFAQDVVASLPYAILGVGRCAKWDGVKWRTCLVEGDKDYFEAARDNLPYEVECVEYATQEAYDMLSWDLDRDNLHLLAQMHAPRRPFSKQEYARLFACIDAKTADK